uniref:Uncharacterized protein n=1 Tax=Hucho hucho TaxID=62062 RepID=A0A4W5PS16_9TELE
MLGDLPWLAVSVPIYPKGVRWSSGQGSVEAKFFNTNLDKPFLYGPRFVHRGIVMLKQERAFPKMLPQSWKHRIAAVSGKCVTASTTGRQELRKDLCVRKFDALKACRAVAEKTVYNLGDWSL